MIKNTLIHLIDAKLNLLDIVLKLFALNYPKKKQNENENEFVSLISYNLAYLSILSIFVIFLFYFFAQTNKQMKQYESMKFAG